MRILLLTIIMADSKWFIIKNKQIIYTKVFMKLYNLKKHKQVHKIYRIINLKNNKLQ